MRTWSYVLLLLGFATIEALGQTSAPASARVTTCPAGEPRTKGRGWPEMPTDAKIAMDRFRKALSEKKWDQALSYCGQRTWSHKSRYGAPEEFFHRFIPMEKFLAESSYRFWTHRQDKLGGEIVWLGCSLPLADGPDGLDISWQWWMERSGDRWIIDLPDVPVDRWCEEQEDRLKRYKEKEDANWRALEPKLKGLRTELTALQQEYRLGQPMPFRLELVNEGEFPLSYDHQQVAVNNSMVVEDESGQCMRYTAGPFQTIGAARAIQPGQRVVLFASLDIANQYRITTAGKYKVRFSGSGLSIEDAPGLHHGVARRQFPSNTVEIEVKP